MTEKTETIHGLIIRAAGYLIKFRVPYESIPLQILYPKGMDEKVKKEFAEIFEKNKEEIKGFVIIRDLSRHPIKPEAVIDVAKEVFGGKEVPQQKDGPDPDFSGVPY